MRKLFSTIIMGSLLLALGIVTFPEKAAAQSGTGMENRAITKEMVVPEKGTRIWTGTAGLFRNTNYSSRRHGNSDDVELVKRTQTVLGLNFRHFRFSSSLVSFGLQGLGQVHMDGTFGGIGLGTAALGPLVRVYPFSKSLHTQWQLYAQGGFLAGFNMALGDAIGGNAGSGFRFRPGLRAGVTYRVSNAFGIYLETGPDWEADESFQFDSRAWQLEVGIQLFRF